MESEKTTDTVIDSTSVIDIKTLSIGARQEAFLEDYRKIASKWGIDFQPAYRIVDLFALQATNDSKVESQLEGVKEESDVEAKG